MIASEVIQHVLDNGVSLVRPRIKDFEHGQPIQYDVKDGFTGKKRGWFYFDTFTASAMSQVFKALKPETQEKFNCLPIPTLVDFVWKKVQVKR